MFSKVSVFVINVVSNVKHTPNNYVMAWRGVMLLEVYHFYWFYHPLSPVTVYNLNFITEHTIETFFSNKGNKSRLTKVMLGDRQVW